MYLPVIEKVVDLLPQVEEAVEQDRNFPLERFKVLADELVEAKEKMRQEEQENFELKEKQRKLRALYGEVVCVFATAYNPQGESEEIHAWFKRPKMEVIDAVSSLDEKEDMSRAINVLFSSCWIEGDDRIRTTDYLKIDAFRALQPFLKKTVARIKKL